jgi:hypothetical protein
MNGEFFAGTILGGMFAPGTVSRSKNTDTGYIGFAVYNCGSGQKGQIGMYFPMPVQVQTYTVMPLSGGAYATWSPDPNAQFVNVVAQGTITVSNYDAATGRLDGAADLTWAGTDHLTTEFTIFLPK